MVPHGTCTRIPPSLPMPLCGHLPGYRVELWDPLGLFARAEQMPPGSGMLTQPQLPCLLASRSVENPLGWDGSSTWTSRTLEARAWPLPLCSHGSEPPVFSVFFLKLPIVLPFVNRFVGVRSSSQEGQAQVFGAHKKKTSVWQTQQSHPSPPDPLLPTQQFSGPGKKKNQTNNK